MVSNRRTSINARLAARLTGWRIDIKSETQLEEEEAGLDGQEWAEGEWITDEDGNQVWKPAEGGEALSAAEYATAAVEEAASAETEVASEETVEVVVEEPVAEEASGEASEGEA